MRALRCLKPEQVQRLRGLLFDLDDTLLDHGRLTIEAYSSLFRLKAAGFQLFGVTGRPAAWGQVVARQWPVDGVVTENGIIALRKQDNRIRIYDRATAKQRSERTQRLQALSRQLQSRWPELLPADDAFGRIADTALDIAESSRVEPAVVEAAATFARSRGARVVISSIQMHLALDPDDKATGSLRFLNQVFGVDPNQARFDYAFIGDSDNDAACFAAFDVTVGVQNLQGNPTLNPKFITSHPRGTGFAEFADALVRLKRPEQ